MKGRKNQRNKTKKKHQSASSSKLPIERLNLWLWCALFRLLLVSGVHLKEEEREKEEEENKKRKEKSKKKKKMKKKKKKEALLKFPTRDFWWCSNPNCCCSAVHPVCCRSRTGRSFKQSKFKTKIMIYIHTYTVQTHFLIPPPTIH